MRALILALLPVVCSAGDYTARDQRGNSLRLTDGACPAEVLAHVPAEWHQAMHAASVSLDGARPRACWALRDDGKVVVQLDDGRILLVPAEQFEPAEPV